MSAHVVVVVQPVGVSPCSSSRPCTYASVGFSDHYVRLKKTATDVSTSVSKNVSSVNALKRGAASRIDHRNGSVGATEAALFPFLRGKKKDVEKVKIELLDAIAPLDRGANASPDDIERVDLIAKELEKLNPCKEPLKSPLLNGKWKLLYTTSESILKKSRLGFLRPNGPIYQAINTDTLRAQNLETWPYYNQVTANLEPIDSKQVLVKFDFFKIGGLSIFLNLREMDVASRFLHHISKAISLLELCVQSYNSIDNAGYHDDFESAEWKKPSYSVETQPAHSGRPDVKWCGLCGTREGWMRCGSCMGEGGYVTKPGLAGVKSKVGWSRCKTCFGHKFLPCLLCGLNDDEERKKGSEVLRSTQQQKMFYLTTGVHSGQLKLLTSELSILQIWVQASDMKLPFHLSGIDSYEAPSGVYLVFEPDCQSHQTKSGVPTLLSLWKFHPL